MALSARSGYAAWQAHQVAACVRLRARPDYCVCEPTAPGTALSHCAPLTVAHEAALALAALLFVWHARRRACHALAPLASFVALAYTTFDVASAAVGLRGSCWDGFADAVSGVRPGAACTCARSGASMWPRLRKRTGRHPAPPMLGDTGRCHSAARCARCHPPPRLTWQPHSCPPVQHLQDRQRRTHVWVQGRQCRHAHTGSGHRRWVRRPAQLC